MVKLPRAETLPNDRRTRTTDCQDFETPQKYARERYSPDMDDASSVIEFWLGTEPEVPKALQERWWRKDAAFDAEVASKFGDLHRRAATGELDSWSETANGRLALILVLDQFSRNLHRDSPLAWSHDAKAQALTLEGIERSHDRLISLYGRVFLYMPLMHAEDPSLQKRSIDMYQALANEAPPSQASAFHNNLEFARRHQEIVDRFGRFPHRNAILGRPSSAEESAFLKEPNSSF